uniref:uncharacterized protein LOC122595635 n=1 Tax=Erigeron canadensis TaxID=72917 RepID=UPI001CB89A40|nr:uncharacterized protein LOC122595635 [Erigeron canadensis]
MGSPLIDKYINILEQLQSFKNIPQDLLYSLQSYCMLIYRSDQQNRFNEPMPWIGIYIALASLLCILAMVADLLHGLRNRKLWFPSTVDQAAKLGSLSFMCTMMANLLPSLGTMGNKELLTNLLALGVLVITLVVNVCIQIKTGLVSYAEVWQPHAVTPVLHTPSHYSGAITFSYVVMLIFLLIIYISSALTVLTAKQLLESKYQSFHSTSSKDQELQQPGSSVSEKLKQHVRNCCIMASTGSPQFVLTHFATTSASGVICASSAVLHVYIIFSTFRSRVYYMSEYKWSMLVILIIQLAGVVLGTIAPISRCFTALSFKFSAKWIWNHIKVFEVESYWTQKIYDLKESSMPFLTDSRKSKIAVQKLKVPTLKFCIGFQKATVVACKMIGIIPIFFVICILYCLHCWKWLKSMFIASQILLVIRPEQHDTTKDISHYVLQVQDDMELAERTLRSISNSVNRLIQKAEKQQPNNLVEFLERSRGFLGVQMFDSHQVPPIFSEEPVNCWSLPLVTLTSIAISLPNIQGNKIQSLLSCVSEGIVYVTVVEESLNTTNEYATIQKASKTLWLEVEVYHKWLGNRMQKLFPQVNSTGEILRWFRDTAKNMVTEIKSMDTRGLKGNSIAKSISANSMYRISQTILLYYHDNIDQISQDQLFERLSSIIADIMGACFTNLPRVIEMKCNSTKIEKRETSVQVAAQLLGETTQILNILQDCELPRLNPHELPFIDKWRTSLKQPFP